MKTPNACLTRTIHMPGFGSAARPAPAIGHGIAMPSPRQDGSASAILVLVAYRLLEKSTTWITTCATHAPASSAAIARIENAITNVPVPAPGEKREPKLETA